MKCPDKQSVLISKLSWCPDYWGNLVQHLMTIKGVLFFEVSLLLYIFHYSMYCTIHAALLKLKCDSLRVKLYTSHSTFDLLHPHNVTIWGISTNKNNGSPMEWIDSNPVLLCSLEWDSHTCSALHVSFDISIHLLTPLSLISSTVGGKLEDIVNTVRLMPRHVLRIFYETCSAVAHMHSQTPGIVHRDLKVTWYNL